MSSEIAEAADAASQEGGEITLESPDSYKTPSKKRRISGGRLTSEEAANIWQFFEYKAAKNVSVCKACGKTVPKKEIGNNVKHLKIHHPSVYAEYQLMQEMKEESSGKATPSSTPRSNMRQLTLRQVCERSAQYKVHDERQQEITAAIARLFAANSLSHLMAECPAWRQFLSTIDKRYVPSARAGIKREIMKETENLRKKTEMALSTARKISICVDLWSKRSLTASFVGITAHYYCRTRGRLVRILLPIKEIKGSHTADNIYDIVNDVLDSWNIDPSKIRCFVTDNGSNVVKAFRNVNELIELELQVEVLVSADSNLEEESAEDDFDDRESDHFICFGRQKRLPCYAHLMVNALKCTIESSAAYKEILQKSTELIKSFTTSTKKTQLLQDRAKRRLISPVRTRWLYAYFMLQRLLDLKEHIQEIIVEEEMDAYLSPNQWRQIEILVEFLKEFAEQVTYLEGEQYATISHVIPSLLELLEHCEEFKAKPMFESMAKKVTNELKSRFATMLDRHSDNYQPLFSVATFMDPTLRNTLKISDQFESAKAELLRMGQVFARDQGDQTTQDSSSDTVLINITNRSVQFKRLFKKMGSTQAIFSNQSQQLPVSEEIEKYLIEDSGMNALEFWQTKMNAKEFPILCEIAWDVFSVPATSAPIERVFSHAGIASSGRRARIGADLLNAEIQMKLNFFLFSD